MVLSNSVTISLNVFNSVIYICSQYSPPSGNIDKDFADLGNHFQHFDDVLIAGDLNVPLLQFGYTRQNDRSEILLEHLSEKNLNIVNYPDAEHSFVQGSSKGRPDLTLAGVNICEKIMNWSVDSSTFSFSDHRYIKFSLEYVPEVRYNIRFKTKNKSFAKFNRKIKYIEKNYYKIWVRSKILTTWIDMCLTLWKNLTIFLQTVSEKEPFLINQW